MSEGRAGHRALYAGIALIAITNAIILGGAAYNRSGTPESVLALTGRELQVPFRASDGSPGENSGLMVALRWRAPDEEMPSLLQSFPLGQVPRPRTRRQYWETGNARQPAWLDSAKLASLGFDVTKSARSGKERRFNRRQLSREVLLVLELDGEAYQRSLARSRERSAHEAAMLAAHPDSETTKRSRAANDFHLWNEGESSRLFVIDAGLDAGRLRTTYGDRTRYAIVRGTVKPLVAGPDSAERLTGLVDNVFASPITIPHELHGMFGSWPASPGSGKPVLLYPVPRQDLSDPLPPVVLSVAFGKRLEPWITSAEPWSIPK
jgi:hypothetical protein